MINKIILVEGKNDRLFIKWLLNKAEVEIAENIKLVQVGGKHNFIDYLNKISNSINDIENQIDYGENEISVILLIKDFDLDDRLDEFEHEIKDLKNNHNISLEKYYISGVTAPPKTLETLFINNDGELLRNFVELIRKFSVNNPDKLQKVNDKNIFEAYLKLQNGRIEYNSEMSDAMFAGDKFLKLPDIENLVKKIQEFIKD